ncbi:hypothetical protein [Vagococcus sp. CY53-2]|uniref:hypothetical protein n=1 Tax=Vagococcus sp. CY53-2 TaxID=2925780 RepID=UPI001F50566A|nr:hypothetical protein [Vagococcus sp. CY53-2]MCI0131307.1 hypothetical protein [Vagococcus sp. CY53-2]
MNIIEILFICLISLSIVFLAFSLLNTIIYFINKKKILSLNKKKRHKKKYRKQLRQLSKNQARYLKRALVLFFISVIVMSGYFLTKNYVEKHLFSKDLEIVMSGYFLVDNYEKSVAQAKKSEGKKEEVTKKITDNSNRMASYMTETPSDMLSVDGQRLLNKYYKSLSEVGMNTVPIIQQLYGNEELSNECIQNLNIVKENQKAVFNYFNIDESRIHKK